MNHDGIGLGLMISKALIEANRGQLQIKSDGIDKGSVFAFTMKMKLLHTEVNILDTIKVEEIQSHLSNSSFDLLY